MEEQEKIDIREHLIGWIDTLLKDGIVPQVVNPKAIRANYIPKSKFREKMEELDNMIKEINKRKTSKVHSRRDYSFKEIFTRTYGGIVWKKI